MRLQLEEKMFTEIRFAEKIRCLEAGLETISAEKANLWEQLVTNGKDLVMTNARLAMTNSTPPGVADAVWRTTTRDRQSPLR